MDAVVNKVIKHIEFEGVKTAVLDLISNFSLDPHFTNFLLKSFPQYPHYHSVCKESTHTAQVIGKQHYKLNKTEIIQFIKEYLEKTEYALIQERKDCWEVFNAKVKFSRYYKHLLNSSAYQEVSQYVIKSFNY